jgi:hypothetical protein
MVLGLVTWAHTLQPSPKFQPEDCRRLLSKAAEALRPPGGDFVKNVGGLLLKNETCVADNGDECGGGGESLDAEMLIPDEMLSEGMLVEKLRESAGERGCGDDDDDDDDDDSAQAGHDSATSVYCEGWDSAKAEATTTMVDAEIINKFENEGQKTYDNGTVLSSTSSSAAEAEEATDNRSGRCHYERAVKDLHIVAMGRKNKKKTNDSVSESSISSDSLDKSTPSAASDTAKNSNTGSVNRVKKSGNQSRNVLSAHRETLVTRSSMFAAMLGGAYREASQSEVTLTDVHLKPLSLLLHFLHGCDEGCSTLSSLHQHHHHHQQHEQHHHHQQQQHRQQHQQKEQHEQELKQLSHDNDDDHHHYLQQHLRRLMESIVLADRFLLSDFAHYLCSIIATSGALLTGSTAEEVLRFCLFHNLTDLAEDSLRALLLSWKPVSEIGSCVTEVMRSRYGNEMVVIMLSLFRRAIVESH